MNPLPSDCEELNCKWRSPDNNICRKPIRYECPMDTNLGQAVRDAHERDFPEDARARRSDGGL